MECRKKKPIGNNINGENFIRKFPNNLQLLVRDFSWLLLYNAGVNLCVDIRVSRLVAESYRSVHGLLP